MIEVTLPYPPSVNHYWRHWQGRVLISREGRGYRSFVRDFVAVKRLPKLCGRLGYVIKVFVPDRRRRDIANIEKCTIDSLQHAGLFDDDEQFDLEVIRRMGVVPGGRVDVRLFRLRDQQGGDDGTARRASARTQDRPVDCDWPRR